MIVDFGPTTGSMKVNSRNFGKFAYLNLCGPHNLIYYIYLYW